MGRSEGDLSQPTLVENLSSSSAIRSTICTGGYFAWNFIGRQNDLYSDGSNIRGGVSTGLPFIDDLVLGSGDDLPDEITNNKGRNVYYLLPFILRILGIVFQLMRGARGVQSFWVVFFLFFMTGLAIVMYINKPRSTP